ncbi:MAG TPA: hypothetical protein DDZ89_00655 [Clostridiales bacterium]|nr:hypothetical protein [Clostridiales bacterium]
MEKVLVIVEESPVMIDFWQKYRKKYNYAAYVTWEMVTNSVKMLLKKITTLKLFPFGLSYKDRVVPSLMKIYFAYPMQS